jgi:hypothetical protein
MTVLSLPFVHGELCEVVIINGVAKQATTRRTRQMPISATGKLRDLAERVFPSWGLASMSIATNNYRIIHYQLNRYRYYLHHVTSIPADEWPRTNPLILDHNLSRYDGTCLCVYHSVS